MKIIPDLTLSVYKLIFENVSIYPDLVLAYLSVFWHQKRMYGSERFPRHDLGHTRQFLHIWVFLCERNSVMYKNLKPKKKWQDWHEQSRNMESVIYCIYLNSPMCSERLYALRMTIKNMNDHFYEMLNRTSPNSNFLNCNFW